MKKATMRFYMAYAQTIGSIKPLGEYSNISEFRDHLGFLWTQLAAKFDYITESFDSVQCAELEPLDKKLLEQFWIDAFEPRR